MLTLKILVNDGLLAQEEVDYLVMSKVRNRHGGDRLPCHVQGRHRLSAEDNGHPWYLTAVPLISQKSTNLCIG